MGIRFALSIAIGLSVVAGLAAIVFLTEGIEPQDFRATIGITGFIGMAVGAVVGIAWGIRAESGRKLAQPPATSPDQAPCSDGYSADRRHDVVHYNLKRPCQ